MANPDRPAGLKPVKYLNGVPWNGAIRMYYSAGTHAIYMYSPVRHAGGGSADGKTPSCDIADTSHPILGVAVGFGNTPNLAAYTSNLEKAYAPASLAMYIAVVDDPNVLFEVQEDNGSSAHMEAADIGRMIALAGHSGGNANTGLSTAELDSDGDAADVNSHAAQLQVHAVVNRVDNTMGSSADHTKWLVRIADHHTNDMAADGDQVGV